MSQAAPSLIQHGSTTVFRLFVIAGLIVASVLASELLRPTVRLADVKSRVNLEQQIPSRFGAWEVDRTMVPILPSPDVQSRLDEIYTQVLARTYVNRRGQRVMLSIAYGSDQGSEATAVHRPEFCYSAQGFKVDAVGSGVVSLDDRKVPTRWLIGHLGPRREPISYWVTLDESATLPGLGRKLTQLAYGLAGEIPDGMLVRVSNIAAAGDDDASFALHKQFVQELKDAVPAGVRNRYFGQ